MEQDQFISSLKKRKLKATSARIKLLSVISEYGRAVADSAIRQKMNEFDRVTVYRTINTLLEKGVIHEALKEDSNTYYALCDDHCSHEAHDHQHVHFKCESCNEVTCISLDEELKIQLKDVAISSIEINAKGRCAKCE